MSTDRPKVYNLNKGDVNWEVEFSDHYQCTSNNVLVAESVIVSLENGALRSRRIHQNGAYDSIDKKIAVDNTVTWANGTVDKFKVISDYKKV